ncbi:MAG TPA: hypothetical protein VL282_15275 [Tepidisphaeraceae bacterium]|jgi:hypothetical protein|nr:hypothetical protein [Tepidisphaeraceae bacterium]
MSTATPIEDVELLCPLCEYNLRGLEEPRCPECGHRSTWEELRQRQPNHPYLFERHPQRNVWSFGRTILGAMLPRTFWRELSPTLRPIPRRLYWFAAWIVLLGLTAVFISAIPDIYNVAQRNATQRPRLIWQYTLLSKPGTPNFNAETAKFVASLKASGSSIQQWVTLQYPPITRLGFWTQLFAYRQLSRGLTDVGLLVLCWGPLTFASLLIFRASLRQAKIKPVHVARCVIYSGAVLILAAVIYYLSSIAYPHLPFTWFAWTFFGDPSAFTTVSLLLLWLGYRLSVSYAEYLRFNRPYLTVFASQTIVALALWKIMLASRGM